MRTNMACIGLLLLVCFSSKARAQEPGKEKESPEPRHSIGLTIGHEHSFSGRTETGAREVLVLPFWGLDYNFKVSPKFILGLHTDFIVESYKVEKNLQGGEEEVVERTRPIAPAVMAIYKPVPHWSFALGAGGEFAKEENYFLNRAAIEYGVEIRRNWEVFGSFQYDIRWNAYDTWTLGLGISKGLGKKKK